MKKALFLALTIVCIVALISLYGYVLFFSGLIRIMISWIQNSGTEYILIWGIIPIPIGKLISIVGTGLLFLVPPIMIIYTGIATYRIISAYKTRNRRIRKHERKNSPVK